VSAGEGLVIHTDGACRGNPGPGGWGALLSFNGTSKELSGSEPDTTNNRMELMGAIMGLTALKRPSVATVQTDSQYVIKGITEWLPSWKARGWRTADKKPVKNQDLWERLDAIAATHTLRWQWVKGHSGDPGNERVDELANLAIDAMLAASQRQKAV
jgi:ribonuclease HI